MTGQVADSVGKKFLDVMLRRSPAQQFFRWRSGRNLVILTYHGVTDEETFTDHMRYLAQESNPVSADAVCTAIRKKESLPRRSVLVTFDDGDRSVYDTALPIMESLGIPSVVFVVPALLDTDQPFWWKEAEELTRRGARLPGKSKLSGADAVRAIKRYPNNERLAALASMRASIAPFEYRTPQLSRSEVKEMESRGVEVGSHSMTHPCLDRCDDETIRMEVTAAHEVLTAILGRPPRLFAYPNGNVDDRVKPILARLGYEAAFLFDHMIGRFPPTDPLEISRLRVNSYSSLDRFRTIASGLHPTLHRMRRLF